MYLNYFKSFAWAILASSSATLAAPTTDEAVDVETLPSVRLSQDLVEKMKANAKAAPGTVLNHVSLPIHLGANETRLVPVVQGDADIFLDNEAGIHARSLAPRGSCIVWGPIRDGCELTYCWSGQDGSVYTAYLNFVGSSGANNPTYISNSNANYIQPYEYNTGALGWFRSPNNECRSGNTQVATYHRLTGSNNALHMWNAAHGLVDHFRCNDCRFGGLTCDPRLEGNLVAFANGDSSGSICRNNDEL